MVSKPLKSLVAKFSRNHAGGSWIGIDLGATNTCFGYFKDGLVQIHQDNRGKTSMPSVVSFEDNNVVHVGEDAINQQNNNVIYYASTLLRKQ